MADPQVLHALRRKYAVLRDAVASLTIHEIAVLIVQREGLTYTPALGQNIRASVRDVLNRRVGNGVVRHDTKPIRWSMSKGRCKAVN